MYLALTKTQKKSIIYRRPVKLLTVRSIYFRPLKANQEQNRGAFKLHKSLRRTYMRALFISMFGFFALAMSATAGTIVLQDDFQPWNLNLDGGYANGYDYNYRTLTTYQGSYEAPDGSGRWITSYQGSSLNERKDNQVSITMFTDPTSNSGRTNTLYESLSFITNSYIQTVLFPFENITHVYGQKSRSLIAVSENTTSTYDCRDLVLAGLSGGCAGTNSGYRYTDNYLLASVWFSYDINNLGEIVNYLRGEHTPYFYRHPEYWDYSFPSQPSGGLGTETPEPTTFVLMGAGLVGIAAIRRQR